VPNCLCSLSRPHQRERPGRRAHDDAAEIQLALKNSRSSAARCKSGTSDDENTALNAWLANDASSGPRISPSRAATAARIFSATKRRALGVIRTQELLAARRIDGREQFFTRAIDFGYTKSPMRRCGSGDTTPHSPTSCG